MKNNAEVENPMMSVGKSWTQKSGVSSSLHWQQESCHTDSADCTWMLILAVNSPNDITVTSAGCSPARLSDSLNWLVGFCIRQWGKKRKKHPSIDGQTLASLGRWLTDWLASHFGNRVKVLPQQFQDVVRVIVSRTAHPAQLHGLQVGVRWDVGGRAVELVQCEPQGVWVHLD